MVTKKIKKETLDMLMRNNRTEIILFLPISHMYRFIQPALVRDDNCYKPLKELVFSFFDDRHPIRTDKVTVDEYIDYLKIALRYVDKYYTTSYYIERDVANLFALFFLSSHIYGFEKILEVKWELDQGEGRGFRQPKPAGLFDAIFKQETELTNYKRLESILREALSAPKNNKQLYEIILKNEFIPTQATEIFKDWQNTNPNFRVINISNNQEARKGSFYVNWDNYKNDPKVMFTLI